MRMDNCCGCAACRCPSLVGDTGTVGIDHSIRPKLDSNNVVWWGCFPPGEYTIKYCGGAWEYYVGVHTDDWVATKLPALTTGIVTTWPTRYPIGSDRSFYHVLYVDEHGPQSLPFSESEPPNWGYDSESEAISAGRAIGLTTIQHAGGRIGIAFWDNTKTDNQPGESLAPRFALCTSVDTGNFNPFIAGTTCGSIVSGRYRVVFSVFCYCAFSGVSAALDTSGNISSPTTATGLTFTEHGTTSITIEFDLDDETNKSFIATLKLTGGDLPFEIDLEFDMTPVITASAPYGAQLLYNCPSTPQYVAIRIFYVSGLPLRRADGSSDLLGSVSSSSLSAALGLSCDIGPWTPIGDMVECVTTLGGLLPLNFQTTAYQPASVTFEIHWVVGSVTLPPSSLTLDLTW